MKLAMNLLMTVATLMMPLMTGRSTAGMYSFGSLMSCTFVL
jgi:hypothetical protein